MGNQASAEATSGLPRVTKYFYHSGKRVAMRKAGTLTYLHADHLGSTSLAADADGGFLSRVLYYPYGETWYTEGTLPTDYRFTGQRAEMGLGGLYDYHARYYDPFLARFISADTIVPEPGNPQAHNRYAYVANNPLIYTDPSGHGWVEDLLIGIATSGPVGKALVVNAGEAVHALNDPVRSSSMENIRQSVGGGLAAWGGVAAMAEAAYGHTGSAIAEGRWEDAARGAAGVARMHGTMGTVPLRAQWELAKGIATSPIRAAANAWESGTTIRECAAGERSGWDVEYHGLVLTGDLLAVGGALNSRMNSEVARAARAGQQWQGDFPTYSSSEYLYRPGAGQTVGHLARYDSAGQAMYRVDMVGPPDAGVPTPHLHAAQWNTNPATGVTYFNDWALATPYSLGYWPIFAYSPFFYGAFQQSD